MWFKSQRYNNAALQKFLLWFICACYNTKRNFQMLFLNSPITNCKIIPIHAMLSMNIHMACFQEKDYLLGSLCASGIQWSLMSYWKLTCLVFIFITLETIAVAVFFAASSRQSKEMGNWKILGTHISAHSYATFQGMYLILFTCLCSFKSVETAPSLSDARLWLHPCCKQLE